MIIQVPVTTEVLNQNEDLHPNGKAENQKLIIEIDTRKRNYQRSLGLKRKTKIGWINERCFEVQELSAFAWPILYRVTTADGYYKNEEGERVYFTPEIAGMSTKRKVSDVVVRLGVYLSIIAGLGTRAAALLMKVLFQVEVSKSAIDRWIDEIAETLPSEEEMVKKLHQQKPVTSGHLDELFPRGGSACLLVLKDEHGRILLTEEVEKRDEEHVKPFLERIKKIGLDLQTFYTDHWQAYANAIKAVFPNAHLQLDYFHILQNIWRKVMDEFRRHRRNLKERGEAAETAWYAEKLKRLAAELWKHRYIFFKSDKNLSDKEKEIMQKVLNTQPEVRFLRGFLNKVWAIFNGPTTEVEAQLRLMELKQYAQFHEDDGYSKSITFLEENFKNMTTFLRVEGVKRNSLSETGMRVLRRLEQNHDGFRSKQGRQNAIRIYQAVTYLGWTIHNPPKLTDSSG
jgi:transposase-like protein